MHIANLRESIVVNRPVSDCYRYLLDFSSIEQWDPGVHRSRKLTPGKPRAGSEFEVCLAGVSRGVVMRYRLIEAEPDRRLLLEGQGGGVKAQDIIELQPVAPGRTQIVYGARINLEKVPALAAPLMKPLLTRIGRAAVAGLQRALEGPLAAPAIATPSPKLGQRLVVPAALAFTESGYRRMPDKGLSRFMDGKTVALTGPTSGIGLAAACELARLGARLVLVGRGRQRMTSTVETITDFAGDCVPPVIIEADLAHSRDVDRAADAIAAAAPRLDVLINNAGALFDRRLESADGLEMTLAVNLLAPYRLTRRLMPCLDAAGGRVINVASGGQYLQPLDLGDLQSSMGRFDGVKAYARMKRGLVALTRQWAREHPSVAFHSMHPGWVSTPGVSRSLPTFNRVTGRFLRDPRMGADTIVWLASSDASLLGTGLFWFDRQPQPVDIVPFTSVSDREVAALQASLGALVPA